MDTLTWVTWASLVTTAIVAYWGIERLHGQAEQSTVLVPIPVQVDYDPHKPFPLDN